MRFLLTDWGWHQFCEEDIRLIDKICRRHDLGIAQQNGVA
jgi:hypothetical protein